MSRRTVIAGIGTLLTASGVAQADHYGPNGETSPGDPSKSEKDTSDGSTPTPNGSETPVQTKTPESTPEPTETETETATETPSREYEPMVVEMVSDCTNQRVAVDLTLTVPDHNTVYVGYDTHNSGTKYRKVDMNGHAKAQVSGIRTTDDIELLTERGYQQARHAVDYSDEVIARWQAPDACVGREA